MEVGNLAIPFRRSTFLLAGLRICSGQVLPNEPAPSFEIIPAARQVCIIMTGTSNFIKFLRILCRFVHPPSHFKRNDLILRAVKDQFGNFDIWNGADDIKFGLDEVSQG